MARLSFKYSADQPRRAAAPGHFARNGKGKFKDTRKGAGTGAKV